MGQPVCSGYDYACSGSTHAKFTMPTANANEFADRWAEFDTGHYPIRNRDGHFTHVIACFYHYTSFIKNNKPPIWLAVTFVA